MKSRSSTLSTAILGLLMFVLITGCGRNEGPDFSVLVTDPQGITNGGKVEWRGTTVGRITQIGQAENRTRVDVTLSPDYKNAFSVGLTARTSHPLLGGATALELFGGDDPRMQKLKPGATIEEAAPESIWASWKLMAAGALILALIVLIVLLKLIGRILAFGFALALLVFSLWFCRLQYLKNQDAFRGTRIEMLMSTMQEKLIDAPEAAAFWSSMRSETTNLIGVARQKSEAALSEQLNSMQTRIEMKAAEMIKAGEKSAAERLQATFETFRKKVQAGQAD